METRYNFSGRPNVTLEQVVDTDLTHDSPHHTIGKGSTQAAAGNHQHKAEEIVTGIFPQEVMPYKIGRSGPYAIAADSTSAVIIITHGLGKAPSAVFVSVDDDAGICNVIATVESFNATTLSAKMRCIGSAEGAVYLNWLAFP